MSLDQYEGPPTAEWGGETFSIDLNSLREDNRVVAIVGFDGPQRVPEAGEMAIVVDEDGHAYDAIVERVLPDSRIYLRIKWESKRASTPLNVPTFGGPSWGIGQSEQQAVEG